MGYDTFLSYDRRDQNPAEEIAAGLGDRGVSVFLDRWYLTPGKPWPKALQNALDQCGSVAVIVGRKEMGEWQSRETWVALDKQAHNEDFRVIPVLLPGADGPLGFLGLNTWIDVDETEGGEKAALDLLALAVRGEPQDPDLFERLNAVRATISPYRGLRPFREEDAPLFFGREKFVDKLVRVVSDEPVVAVVGPSGSGKSSVVSAGLMPALRGGADGQVWDAVRMAPGRFPLSSLAAVLLPKLEPAMGASERIREVPRLAESLRQGRVQLGDVVQSALDEQHGTDRMLLVVDQWEELYTLADERAEADRLIESVLGASANGPLTLVLTMRGDFYGRAIANRTLADQLQDAVVNLSGMTRGELERAIVRPAAEVGLRFEDALSDQILNDVGNEPGNLPLLQFVLDELWERRSDDTLTHAAYEAIGGLQGAIAKRSEDTISPEERSSARNIFLRLVEPGIDAPDTRRRAYLSELSESEPLVRSLIEARLLVSDWDEATDQETIEVSHETLIHSWDRLRDWISEDREFLVWRSRLIATQTVWERENQDDGALLRGGPLGEAERWLDERRSDLSDDQAGFVSRSHDVAKRARRRTVYILAAGLAFFALLAIAASAYAFNQRNQVIDAAGELDDLKATAADLSATIEQQQSTVDSAQANIADAEARAVEAQADADQAQAELISTQGFLADAQELQRQAEAELVAITAQLDDTLADLDDAAESLIGVQGSIETASERLDELGARLDEQCDDLRASDLYNNTIFATTEERSFTQTVNGVCTFLSSITNLLEFDELVGPIFDIGDIIIIDPGLFDPGQLFEPSSLFDPG